MPKEYPLELNNWGEDDYIVGCKGHHAIIEFEQAIASESQFQGWPLGKPVHEWLKAVPHAERGTLYVNVNKDTKGAFPATVAYEDHDYQSQS